jgi:hypothetical protein
MEYREQRTLEEAVNTRGSRLWTKMNDNSKSEKNRQLFVEENGGFFVREGRYWKWNTPVKEKNGYWLKRADSGEKVFFENMTKFGNENGLTAVKICELLNGKRKTYKGWTAVEIREVKDSVGSNEKLKEPKKDKIKITMGAVLQDITTGEILNISSIADFAKDNNLDYANLRKLAVGKAKTYRNLKLFNPIEKYKALEEPK